MPNNLFLFIWHFLESHKKYLCIYCVMAFLCGLWNHLNMFLVSKTISLLNENTIIVTDLIWKCSLIIINFIIFDNITWRSIAYAKFKFLPDLIN